MITKTQKEMILSTIKRKSNIIRNKFYAKISQQPSGSDPEYLMKEIVARNQMYALVLEMYEDELLEGINEVFRDLE